MASVQYGNDIRDDISATSRKLPLTYNIVVSATKNYNTLKQGVFPKTRFTFNIIMISSCSQKVYERRIFHQLLRVLRMKSVARSYVYWPNIDSQISDFVRSCGKCASVSCQNDTNLLDFYYHYQAYGAYSRGHCCLGSFFVIIVDSFSK